MILLHVNAQIHEYILIYINKNVMPYENISGDHLWSNITVFLFFIWVHFHVLLHFDGLLKLFLYLIHGMKLHS